MVLDISIRAHINSGSHMFFGCTNQKRRLFGFVAFCNNHDKSNMQKNVLRDFLIFTKKINFFVFNLFLLSTTTYARGKNQQFFYSKFIVAKCVLFVENFFLTFLNYNFYANPSSLVPTFISANKTTLYGKKLLLFAITGLLRILYLFIRGFLFRKHISTFFLYYYKKLKKKLDEGDFYLRRQLENWRFRPSINYFFLKNRLVVNSAFSYAFITNNVIIFFFLKKLLISRKKLHFYFTPISPFFVITPFFVLLFVVLLIYCASHQRLHSKMVESHNDYLGMALPALVPGYSKLENTKYSFSAIATLFLKNRPFLKKQVTFLLVSLNKNALYFNNFMPFTDAFCLSNPKKLSTLHFTMRRLNRNDLLKKLSSRLDSDLAFVVFLQQYFYNFIEMFFRSRIFFKFNFFTSRFSPTFLKFIFTYRKKLITIKKIAFSPGYALECVFILWCSCFLRETDFFIFWFAKKLTLAPIKKHKAMVKFLWSLVFTHSAVFLLDNKIIGLTFDIRGKFGVTGNSKKRHFFFAWGLVTSFSKKTNKISLAQKIVYTNTGCLGCTLAFFY